MTQTRQNNGDANLCGETQQFDAVTGLKSRKVSCDPSDFKTKYKTELCKYWKNGRECPYLVQCAFAHGYDELRQKTHIPPNYKTKKCKNYYDNGYCPYGERCQFRHADYQHDAPRALPQVAVKVPSGGEEQAQQRNDSSQKKNTHVSYQEVLEKIDQYFDSKSNSVVIYTPKRNMQRLATFENLTSSTCSPYSDVTPSDLLTAEITHLQI